MRRRHRRLLRRPELFTAATIGVGGCGSASIRFETKKYGLAIKEPKSKRGKRTITIDDDLIAPLCAEREKLQRAHAGVPNGAGVNLSLVKLPDDALMFPGPPPTGEDFSLTRLRPPTTKEFLQRAACSAFPTYT